MDKNQGNEASLFLDSEFEGLFFKKEHFLALSKEKQHLNSDEARNERKVLRKRLLELHDIIIPKVNSSLSLESHYQAKHITSSIDLGYNTDGIDAIWLHYGRGEKEIKKYAKIAPHYKTEATPLHFMRMQIILRSYYFGVWLRVGKKFGSFFDREYFKLKMKSDETYSTRFYNLITSLPSNYFINIANEERQLGDFSSKEELISNALKDDWEKYYFIIGIYYAPNNPKLSIQEIESTVMSDMQNLLPLYKHILDQEYIKYTI